MLRCSRGKLRIRKNALVCFSFIVVVSINKSSNLSHASLKSCLIMSVKWGRHGRVLPRAAVELAPALSMSDRAE